MSANFWNLMGPELFLVLSAWDCWSCGCAHLVFNVGSVHSVTVLDHPNSEGTEPDVYWLIPAVTTWHYTVHLQEMVRAAEDLGGLINCGDDNVAVCSTTIRTIHCTCHSPQSSAQLTHLLFWYLNPGLTHILCQTVCVSCLAFWCFIPVLISYFWPSLSLACRSLPAPIKNPTFCLTWGLIPNLPLALGIVLGKVSQFSLGLTGKGRAKHPLKGSQTKTSCEI